MNNKETLQSYNTMLNENNVNLDEVLNMVNTLPDPVISKYAPRMISFYKYSGTDISDKLSKIDGSNCISMKNAFCHVYNIPTISLGDLNTSKVTNMDYMFYQAACTEVDMSNCYTPNLTSAISMFSYNTNLQTVNIKNFDFSKMEKMQYMFMGCTALREIDMSGIDFSVIPSGVAKTDMFKNISSSCRIKVKDETAKQWLRNAGFNGSLTTT